MVTPADVIKANNPEVVAILGDECCHLVCDLELDSLEGDGWVITWSVYNWLLNYLVTKLTGYLIT